MNYDLITVFGILAIILVGVVIYFATRPAPTGLGGFNPNCDTILGCCNGYGPGWRNAVMPNGTCGCVNANATQFKPCQFGDSQQLYQACPNPNAACVVPCRGTTVIDSVCNTLPYWQSKGYGLECKDVCFTN